MSDEQAHAVVYHLLRVQTEKDLTDAQDRFLDALISELVHRRKDQPSIDRCRCRVCLPAHEMRW